MKISAAHIIPCVILAGIGLMIGFGPLNPPTGAVSPTQKTLQEMEPRTIINATNTPGDASSVFIITQPGSYYLTGDVKPTGGKNAILVNADHVTIDLNGYTLDGSLDTTGFRAGITNSAPRRNLVLRNGTIRNFRGYGMIGTFNTSSFENLAFIDSLGGQLEIGQSDGCTVRNVRAKAATGETGIQVGDNATIEFCTVEGGHVGITATTGVIRGCSVVNPTGSGIFMFSGIVESCHVEGANSTSSISNGGIVVSNGSAVFDCNIRNCQSVGVNCISGRADVRDCNFTGCAKGVSIARGTVERNQFTLCTTAVSLSASANSLVIANRFQDCTTTITPLAGNTIGEIINFAGGGVLNNATSSPHANIVY